MRAEVTITLNIGGTLLDMFWDLCSRCGIKDYSVINNAVYKIANLDRDAFVMEPFAEKIDHCSGTFTVAVDSFNYFKARVACEERGVSDKVLIRSYIVRCVNAQRIFL